MEHVAGPFRGTERFELLGQRGSGGTGVVFEALDRERGTRVALKTLKQLEPQALYRLKNEFRTLSDIQHANLVRLGELVESQGTWFLTMELVDGIDFLSWVWGRDSAGGVHWGGQTLGSVDATITSEIPIGASARGPGEGSAPPPVDFDEARLREGLRQLFLAVRTLHRHGFLHRDIKPSNILATPEGRVVLLDFGLVTETQQGRTTEGHTVGTVAYMAPEQASDREVGPAADWYALGTILYEALTGRLPFDGSVMEVLADKQAHEPPPPRAWNPRVPADLDALAVDLLRFDPVQRPSVEALAARLAVPETGSLPPPAQRMQHSRERPFMGRDRELESLWDAWEDARSGRAVTVAVHGESGVGKSTLIRELVRRAAVEPPTERGRAVVLGGRCYERESVPYKAFDGIVDALSRYMRKLPDGEAAALLPRNTGLLARVFPVLGSVEVVARAPAPRHEAKDPHERRRRMFLALRELFSKLCERHDVILAIDDLQWADRDSLLLLADLLRPPEAPPLLLLLTLRTDPGASSSIELQGSVPGDLRELRLGKLDGASASSLARTLLRDAGIEDDALADAIVAEAAGHPLYIDELVRHARVGGEKRQLRLDDAIRARVQRLESGARLLLEVACVAGAPLPQRSLARAARFEGTVLDRALAGLRVAHLLRASGDGDALEPYHDRVREAVLAGLEDDVRVAHHDRLSVVLESAGGSPELLLRHLEAAGKTDKAARKAREAADRAREALAFDRAAELYRAAIRLGPEVSKDLRLEYAEALANAGRGPEAAPAFLAAAEGADPATRLECRRQAAEQWLISGHVETGLGALTALLEELGEGLPRTPRAALRSLLWHRIKLWFRGMRWTERHETQIDAERLTRLDVYRTATHGLAMVDTIRGVDYQSRALLLALATGERSRICTSLAMEASYVASTGGRGLPRARHLVELGREIVEESGDLTLEAWVHTAEGSVHYFAGEFVEAIANLAEGERIFRESTAGNIWALNSARLFRIFALRYHGDTAALAEVAAESVRDARRRGDRYLETTVRRYCTQLHLVADAPDAVRADLAATNWIPAEGTFHIQHWLELEAKAELALYEGAVGEEAASLERTFGLMSRSLLTRVQMLRAPMRWMRGRLLLARGQTVGVGRRVRQLQGEGVGYAGVFAGLLGGGLEAARGNREAAEVHLEEAVRLGERHRMQLHTAMARYRLGQLRGPSGEALRAQSEADLEALGVRDPERLARVFVPGVE